MSEYTADDGFICRIFLCMIIIQASDLYLIIALMIIWNREWRGHVLC